MGLDSWGFFFKVEKRLMCLEEERKQKSMTFNEKGESWKQLLKRMGES